MTEEALAPVVYRTRARLEAAPPATRAETRAIAVEPILAALGWDVRESSLTTDLTVGPGEVEYLFSIEHTPTLAVALESYTDPLEEARWVALREWAVSAGLEALLYTNGQRVRVVAGGEGTAGELLELVEDGALEALRRGAIEPAGGGDIREQAAVGLAVHREEAVEAVTDELVAAGGPELRETFERGTREFLERLVTLLAGDVVPDTGEDVEASIPDDSASSVTPADTREEPETSVLDESPPSVTPADSDEEPETSIPDETPLSVTPADPEGEYVAKFFDGSATVGGIGDSRSVPAFVHAVEFLLERGLPGIDLPWSLEGEVVLAREPAEMPAARELSNGLVLNVGGSLEDRRRRLEALAERAGLRVMLTGDWG